MIKVNSFTIYFKNGCSQWKSCTMNNKYIYFDSERKKLIVYNTDIPKTIKDFVLSFDVEKEVKRWDYE